MAASVPHPGMGAAALFFTGENREKRLIFALCSPILKVKKAAVSGRERYEKLRDHHRQGKRKQRAAPSARRWPGAWASLFTIGISCAWPPMTAASTNNCLPTRRKASAAVCCSAWPRTPTTARSSRRTATTLFPTRTWFRYQAKVMLGLAQNESCVMIGRCADFILRDRPNVLRVFIHAPEEVRVRPRHAAPQPL